MNTRRKRLEDAAAVLYQQGVRLPIANAEDERTLHENMRRIADAGVRKSELLADPDVPLTEAYRDELDEIGRSFKHRLQQLAGDDYDEVADAYVRGERDDWVGALAVYYLECYYRLQERYTVDEEIFFLAILRYPNCFTVNLSFAVGEITSDAVRYESPHHDDTDLSDRHRERYHAECQYSQREAAAYIRENVGCIRDAFPDPDTTPIEDRRYGGFVHITGRRGPVFSEYLGPLTPDPDRFDDTVTTPCLVSDGPEVRTAKREFLVEPTFVA
ncbi:hypothetical protein [Halorubrum halophilum]|uniref:hypothetical protein n=1 Tax=Halorubrum halophilum TaxID=413816 RepID=UPI000679270D|nr:hypothetical protein [Halorubrum halophilum]